MTLGIEVRHLRDMDKVHAIVFVCLSDGHQLSSKTVNVFMEQFLGRIHIIVRVNKGNIRYRITFTAAYGHTFMSRSI